MENKYLFDCKPNSFFSHSINIFGNYFNHNYECSIIRIKRTKEKSIILIGEFVNAELPEDNLDDTVNKLLESQDLNEIINELKYLAGRYLLFYGTEDKLDYIIGDPVSTIPVNYMFTEREPVISSHATFIATEYNLTQSEESQKIVKGAEQQQPLPYNISMYEEIKVLIPNHYLDITGKKIKRYYPLQTVSPVDIDEAVEKTITLTKNILNAYLKKKNISLPITSGIDSRAILALLKDNIEDVDLYTFKLDNFSEQTGDIAVPKKIASEYNINYHILPVINLPDTDNEIINKELSGVKNDNILRNAYTYHTSKLANLDSIPGDIISISKSPFGKKIPEKLATLSYLITKTHNYSPEIKKHINNWREDLNGIYEKTNISIYDLYNWEYRLGRWLPKSIQNYDYYINQLYIFNCRSLIEMWISIPRNQRTDESLHLKIIKKEWPELLEYPLNPDDKILDTIFNNSFLFYIGSHIKYYLKKFINL